MEAAAKNLTPIVLELGGKDPMIVLEDANLDLTTSAAVWGSFSNSGQICSSVERLYVHEKIAKPFLEKFVEKASKLQQGQGSNEDVEVGAMTSEMQIAKVEKQVEDAKRAGAQVLLGGERNRFAGKGTFFKPTILANVTHAMEVMREETFGPVVGVMTFKTDEEAVRLANDSAYGLTASIWTKNEKRAWKMAKDIEAGTVSINESVYTYALAQTPWGGPKLSGIGRTHGKLGLLELVEPKHLHINRVTYMKDFWWYQYDKTKFSLMMSMATVLFGKGILKRMAAAIRFVWLQLKIKNL